MRTTAGRDQDTGTGLDIARFPDDEPMVAFDVRGWELSDDRLWRNPLETAQARLSGLGQFRTWLLVRKASENQHAGEAIAALRRDLDRQQLAHDGREVSA